MSVFPCFIFYYNSAQNGKTLWYMDINKIDLKDADIQTISANVI